MRKRSYDPWCASSQHDHFSRILGQISADADALNHYINLELTKPRKHYRQSRRQVQDSKSIIFCLHYWKESSWVSTSRFFLKNMSRTMSGKCITPVTHQCSHTRIFDLFWLRFIKAKGIEIFSSRNSWCFFFFYLPETEMRGNGAEGGDNAKETLIR